MTDSKPACRAGSGMLPPHRPHGQGDGSAPAHRVLGLDVALRTTGIAVVEERAGSRRRSVFYTTLRIPPEVPVSECLRRIHLKVGEIIECYQPKAAAIEGVFIARNVRTFMRLGEARGAAIAACTEHGVAVYEYPPRRVKQALLGVGSADKTQVAGMVARLLSLSSAPSPDESDALAMALCHLHSRASHPLLQPRPI